MYVCFIVDTEFQCYIRIFST